MVACVAAGLVSVYANTAAMTRPALVFHQSIGALILALAIARVAWRVIHPAPPLPAAMPPSHRIAAAATHAVLYISLLAFPVTGYISLAARGRNINMFGLFDLPLVVPRSLSLSADARNLHDFAQYALYALLALHIGAALYHQFVLKDGLLRRMWWRIAP